MTAVEAEIFVHLADNLPSKHPASTRSITVNVDPPQGDFLLEDKRPGATTRYRLCIPDVAAFGIDGRADEGTCQLLVANLLDAMSAVSKRGIFVEVETKHSLPLIRRNPAAVSTGLGLSGTVSVQLESAVDLARVAVRHVYGKISQFPPGSVEERAFRAFREACRTSDHEAAVRNYCAAIEMSINRGRAPQLVGAALDAEIARLAGHPTLDVADKMHTLYNRTKHADRNPDDQRRYEVAKADLASLAREAKGAAVAALTATILA